MTQVVVTGSENVDSISMNDAMTPPRFPLWRYHRVLAPGAPWRKLIVPAAHSSSL